MFAVSVTALLLLFDLDARRFSWIWNKCSILLSRILTRGFRTMAKRTIWRTKVCLVLQYEHPQPTPTPFPTLLTRIAQHAVWLGEPRI